MITRQHPEWTEYEAHIQRRIAEHVGELESLIDLDRTNFVRGQIAALRRLLADADAPPSGAQTPRYTA